MAKHSTPDGQQSTSEKNGGPRHDTGQAGRHRKPDPKPAGSDVPARGTVYSSPTLLSRLRWPGRR